MTSTSPRLCARCGEAIAVTHVFSKITCDEAGDFDVCGDGGNVAYAFNAAMLAAIRANDTSESPAAYVVEDFCSTRCILAAANSTKGTE